jgi:hypothetical protein
MKMPAWFAVGDRPSNIENSQGVSLPAITDIRPHPVVNNSVINFNLPKDDFVELNVYDIEGRLLTKLMNRHLAAGEHSVRLNSNTFRKPSKGIYYCRLCVGKYTDTRKVRFLGR